MVNDHVKDQMYLQQDQGNLSDEEFAYKADDEMSISDWEAYYERDLHTLWSRIQNYTDETGSSNYMLDCAGYIDFVEFCYNKSSRKMYLYPVGR